MGLFIVPLEKCTLDFGPMARQSRSNRSPMVRNPAEQVRITILLRSVSLRVERVRSVYLRAVGRARHCFLLDWVRLYIVL
jgi:hypothetical protein